MKIGIFDSGLGGLIITKAIVNRLPEYDYIYLGDTKRLPYGNRSQNTIFEFTRQAVEYLFRQGCQIVILGCNTASSVALRRIQKEYLPKKYPGRRVLGMIVPTVEEVTRKKVAVIATSATVNSHVYRKELAKTNPKSKIIEKATPLLVPLIESNAIKYAEPVLKDYLSNLKSARVDSLILGCTHYPILKRQVKKIMGRGVKVISQDEIIPGKLKTYLANHPGIEKKLSKRGKREFLVTDINQNLKDVSKTLFGKSLKFKLVVY